MSEQQTVGDAWRDPISDERKAELKALVDKQREWLAQPEATRGASAFQGVKLTEVEVTWLRAQSEHGGFGPEAGLHLEGANLHGAHLGGAELRRAHLEGADLSGAHLEWASLQGAHLERADLHGAYLGGAHLAWARLKGADLHGAHLEGADLTLAMFDAHTNLREVVLTDTAHWYSALLRDMRREHSYGSVSVANVQWNDADLTTMNWSAVRRLGDERGRYLLWRSSWELEQAASANTQLARRLRAAGMNGAADRFAYRARVCQRGIQLSRGRLFRWLFSWFLYIIAGYGYRPLRTLFWYLAVILGFAFLYIHLGHINGQPFEFDEALVFSVTSFHGRGFFPGGIALDDPITVLAAFEAFTGLVIEVSFIATFTQRFFAR